MASDKNNKVSKYIDNTHLNDKLSFETKCKILLNHIDKSDYLYNTHKYKVKKFIYPPTGRTYIRYS